MTGVVLRARGLGWRVGGREVLQGLDVDLVAGRVVGLIGPNGAGKSTAFGLLSGEVAGEGTVELLGRDLRGMDLPRRARAGLGYLPQGGSSLRGLTAVEQLSLLAEVHGLRGRNARERVAETLEAVGLTPRAGVRVEALSGGERRRLEVGGVLLGRFPVMALDEPFAGVEPRGVAVLASALRAACGRGTAVLLADHAREILTVCDDAVLLVHGRVRLKGPASAMRDDAVVREVYLGAASVSDAKEKPRI